MAQQNIDFGSFPDDPSADAIRTAFSKVQNNFDQLFGSEANTTVNSINRTPGAGITVNYPTGNVVISANIACLLVATTSLKVGRGADNTQSNVTITSSSQQLNIDIDPVQVLSNTFAAPGNNLANFNGTLTSNSYYQPNINTLGTLSSLEVSGNSNFTGNANFTGANINFSNISNLHIPGGSPGYFLQTQDGTGTLAWAAGGGGGNGSPGGVNSQVQFNDLGGFGGNTGFTFNKTTGVLAVPSLSVTGNLIGAFANGNSNVKIPTANGNVNISAAGNANVLIVTGIGVNVASNLNVEDKILANRIEVNLVTGTLTTNAQPNVTSVGTLSSLDVTGNITGGNVYANSGTIGASLLTGTLTTSAQPNVTSTGTLTSLSVSGNANVGNLNVANNVIVTGNLSVLGNATYINIETLEIEDPIISLGGGPNGDPLVANDGKDRGTALQYYTTAPVTAFMGWDNSNSEFAFGSNVAIVSEVVTFTNYGNVRASYFIADNTQFGNANLGNTATANYFVGNLHGSANSATIANTVVDNAQPNITSVGTLTTVSVSGNATVGNLIGRVANGNSGITIAADSNISVTAVGNATAQLIITGTGANVNGYLSVSGNANVGNLNTAGLVSASQVSANSNGNGTNYKVGDDAFIGDINITDTLVIKGQQDGANGYVIFGNADTTSTLGRAGTGPLTYNGAFSVVGNANIGNIGTAGLITATGNVTAGNLVTGGAISATGNANIGNIGTAGLITATGNITGANINGTFYGAGTGLTSIPGANVTGTVANATYAVTAGTANSVAGANVSGQVGNALVAGTVYTNAQPNITSLGTLTSLGVNGTVTAVAFTANTGVFTGNGNGLSSIVGANVTGTVANATYATSAGSAGSATTAGTVTTAAQPNITSTGTLSSLAVTANVTAGNVYANSGIVKGQYLYGDGSNITNLNIAAGSSIVNGTSNVSIPSSGGNVNTVVAGNTTLVVTGTGANITGTLRSTGNANVGNIGATAGVFTTVAGSLTTAAQPNITSVGTLTGVTVNGNTNLGDVGNVKITGGNSLDVLVTLDGLGNLGWGTITFDALSNGTSNLLVDNSSNITMYVAGNATARFTATSTGVVANGTLSVSGTATVGNVATAGTVTASRLISNIATGTAPLTVTSTTRVANLNVATAGVANTVNDAAQPNITSVGTLTGLTVGGNILPSANVTYDLGSPTQRFRDLYLANNTIYLGSNATISANSSAVIITQPGGTSIPLKPGGSNTQVQYNDNGIFGGSGGMVWNEGTTTLTVNNFVVSNNFTSSGYILRSVGTAITAAGTTQGTGTALTKQMNIVSTVASGANGVVLPTAVAGMVLTVTNTTANSLVVYPATNGQINSLGANVGFTMGTTTIQFIAPSTTQWYTVGATYA